MDIGLKGVTKSSTLNELKPLGFSFISFDLRPKSFNFTQKSNILKLVENLESSTNVNLIFENEKTHVITELYQSVKNNLFDSSRCYCEFAGTTELNELEQLNIPYTWHYHDKESLKNIKETNFLQRIVLHHTDLEYLSERGELFGYLHLLADAVENKSISFELQMDWECSLLESMFSYFTFFAISFEITNLVEVSYQNPNNSIIRDQILYYTNLLINKDEI